MHGNIWEWMGDDIDGLKALRGGGFNFHAEGASSAFRVVSKPEDRGEARGIRLVQIPNRSTRREHTVSNLSQFASGGEKRTCQIVTGERLSKNN